LYWRSEGAEYSATAESAGFQGERERESALFHAEFSLKFKSIFEGGEVTKTWVLLKEFIFKNN
jgi:hypothetical protein